MGKQNVSKQEDLRERILKFFEDNKSKGKIFTVRHFQAEQVPKSSIYRILKKANQENGAQRVVGSGRIAKMMIKSTIQKLKTMFENKDGMTLRQVSRKLQCHHSHAQKTLKKYTNIRYLKKRREPKRSQEQQKDAKKKCRELLQKYKNKNWLLDDESYFTLAHTKINGNDGFYTSDLSQTPPTIKYQKINKYEQKLLIWICISSEGISIPYFRESGLAVNQEIYLKECIQKRLIPFINKYPSDDKASSHYTTSVIKFLNDKNINFVSKQENPTKVPECRPIEDFWSILKGRVYQNNLKAQNLDKLKDRIQLCLKKIDINLIKNLVLTLPSRLKEVHQNGVIESL